MGMTGTIHQTLAVLTVSFNEMDLGIGDGWTSPVLKYFNSSSSHVRVTGNQMSWIASLDSIGRILGAILSAMFIDTIGRKSMISTCAVIFFLIWLAILCSSSVMVIYIVRILYGVAKGMNDCTNSVYVGENTSPVFRGVFGTVGSICYYGALVGEYIIATYLSYQTYTAINAAVGFLTVVSIIWIKEPVQFLMMKGKYEKAEKNFLWLKGVDNLDKVKVELHHIKENVMLEKSKKSSFNDLVTSSANYKSFLIVVTTYLLAGAMGFGPISSYAATSLFPKTEHISSNEFTILFGLLQFIVAILAAFFISSFNRRFIIITCSILIALTHICTASLYYVNANVTPLPYFPWLIFGSISLFASIYSFMYPAIFLIRTELFPLSIKAAGGCASLIANSAMSFVTTKVYLLINKTWGIHVNFVAFAVVCVLCAIFVHLTLPETRNKSLIEIQDQLENKKKPYEYNEVSL
ncbi:facilitated trehalose transporter Tret1-like [Planococcus citri]|uniref:facilitated trehalose transporter Tret1-like n=1 Tax=Planococcus citri TaxID=170843 RepID=UPI0031F744F4